MAIRTKRSTSDESIDHGSRVPCSYREAGDDFLCLRYGVWYSSLDCAVRTRYRTCGGCDNCEQGRFNLRRHADVLHRLRIRLPDCR